MATQRILFVTHCEQGQSNVHLATAFEIHARAVPGVEVHLASFAPLRKRFERMRGDGILLESGEKLLPQFHTIDGLTHFDGIDRVGTMRHKPNFEVWPKFANLMVPWTPDEYVVSTILRCVLSVCSHLRYSPDYRRQHRREYR